MILLIVTVFFSGCNSQEEIPDVQILAVEFREIDLSEPFWADEYWEESGGEARGTVDLSQFADQAIESKEMAESIANVILAQRQVDGFLDDFVLRSIRYDPVQNIWVFAYGQFPPIPSFSFYAAVDGNTSELLRMWIYG